MAAARSQFDYIGLFYVEGLLEIVWGVKTPQQDHGALLTAQAAEGPALAGGVVLSVV